MTVINSGSNLHITTQRQSLMADLNRRLDIASREVGTGFKADVFASLGARSAETLSLRANMQRNEGFATTNKQIVDRLDMTAASLGVLRKTAQGFLNFAIPNATSPTATASEVQAMAAATLDMLVGQANLTYQGFSLFSGIENNGSPLQAWSQTNPRSGLSPCDVLASVTGGQITGLADAQAKIAALDAIFSDDPTAPAGMGYEATFYNGTPSFDASGAPSPRLSAVIEEGMVIEYGAQMNDPAFRDILQGLMMLASVNPVTINDREAYATWFGEATTRLARGIESIVDKEARLGSQQVLVTQLQESQLARVEIYRSKVVDLEAIDPYETATRVMQLQTQLEATYQLSARMAKLSFLNFL